MAVSEMSKAVVRNPQVARRSASSPRPPPMVSAVFPVVCCGFAVRNLPCDSSPQVCGCHRFYEEIRSADNGVIGKQIDGGDFDSVAAGNERCHRDETFDGELLAALMKMIGGLHSSPDFLLILGDAVDDGDVGLVGSLVQPQVVELKENAQLVGTEKFLAEAWADFVRIENELASAGLS